MIAAEGHAYRRWWIVLTPPHLAPSDLHRSLNCRDTILALERQINDGQQLSAVTPGKETP